MQVTAAVWCLFALAATQILSAVVVIATMGPTLDATRDYVEGTRDGDTIIASVQIGSYFSLGLGLLFAAGLAVLAAFVNRGNQPARIISWVVLGLLLCCNGIGLVGTAAGGLFGGAGNTGGVDQEELARRIEDAVPGWTTPVNYVLLFVGIVASTAGIILLALPKANEYFRRPQQIWEPPVPGAHYPAPGAETAPAEAAPAEGSTAEASVDITKPPVESTPSTESGEPDTRQGQPGTGNPPPAL
ncbi:hypothetical protein [Virgisporangium aurantiacum]|uniref:hypothetical protein n=1 Tax=Virgisporangium aurantiacum TaxID=175570 RepID=UPI00195191A3|nr:hypothetical protein [Virgisporangium aurantiacum]